MTLFDNIEEGDVEQKYVDFLKNRGYIIIPPKILDATSVRSASALVDYFYSMLQYYNPDRRFHYSKASSVDRRKANAFIKGRMEAGAGNRQRAIKECIDIIRCVVEYESEFLFSEPLHSFDCFGQDKMKWVTDKAISILNNENERVLQQELSEFMDKIAQEQEIEALNTFYDNIEEFNSILGGLRDAKKEK